MQKVLTKQQERHCVCAVISVFSLGQVGVWRAKIICDIMKVKSHFFNKTHTCTCTQTHTHICTYEATLLKHLVNAVPERRLILGDA